LREAIEGDRFFQVMDRARRRRPFLNVLDFYFRVELTIEEFAPIADRLTTSSASELTGLLNVNTVPREILLTLPGLEESDVDALLARRSSPETDLTSIAWVAEVLPAEKAQRVGNLITVRSYQFSADIVAVSGDGRAYRRYRAYIDARQSPPRVQRWTDLTHLGWPLESEILDSIRAGETPVESSSFTSSGVL
jgi:hypothetical protein